MSYKVTLPVFEGPFDLLVYLIETSEMSIYDIRISEITSQYLSYIREMAERQVSLSSDFMVLASELIRIKSKMMLPTEAQKGDGAAPEDPRSDLVERILEYKRFLKAGTMLGEQQSLMMDVFQKPQEDISEFVEHPDETLELELEDFSQAFLAFLDRKQRLEKTRQHYQTVERERETMAGRMQFIAESFRKAQLAGDPVLKLEQLVPDVHDRYDVVVTFVSLLQLLSRHYLTVEQDENYGEILLRPGERSLEDLEPIMEEEEEI